MTSFVSVFVPVYNSDMTIRRCLSHICGLNYPKSKLELVVVDDASTDDSYKIIREFKRKSDMKMKILRNKKNKGIACTANRAVRNCSHSFVASIESDVFVESDWLKILLKEFEDDKVAAAGGRILCYPESNLVARVAGYELEYRYEKFRRIVSNQVSATNVVYRKEILEDVGLFNEDMTYAQENELSYRLVSKGFKLVINTKAVCHHAWKNNLKGYLKQQYHVAYGRLALIRRFKKKFGGDEVSGFRMIVQAPLTLSFVLLLFLSVLFKQVRPLAALFLIVSFSLQIPVSLWTLRKDFLAGLVMPFQLLLRNLAWVSALIVFFLRSIIASART